jgi:hypothetical protein
VLDLREVSKRLVLLHLRLSERVTRRCEKPEVDDRQDPDRDVGGSLSRVQKSWHLVGRRRAAHGDGSGRLATGGLHFANHASGADLRAVRSDHRLVANAIVSLGNRWVMKDVLCQWVAV